MLEPPTANEDLVDVCMANEELSDGEKAAEILPIRIQQLFTLTRLGRPDDAEVLASQIAAEE